VEAVDKVKQQADVVSAELPDSKPPKFFCGANVGLGHKTFAG